jgi:hypothetical protein
VSITGILIRLSPYATGYIVMDARTLSLAAKLQQFSVHSLSRTGAASKSWRLECPRTACLLRVFST